MKTTTSFLAALAAVSAIAAPTVSNLSIDQAHSKTVTISYTIDEPAVITLDILTNGTADAWASIGVENVARAQGDIGVLIPAGRHTISWRPTDQWIAAHEGAYDVRAEVKAWAVTAPPDYMVVDLRSASQLGGAPRIRYYASAEWVPDGVGDRVYKTTKLLMRKIPAKGKTYRMGSPSGELGKSRAYNDWHGGETLFHVTLTNDFYLGVYELTCMQSVERFGKGWWNGKQSATTEVKPVAGDSGTGYMNYEDMRGATYQWPADGHQVTSDSWLGGLRALTGIDFDLPTEAQWEFACRAGTTSALYTGQEITNETTSANLDAIAWYSGNSGNTIHEVGMLAPNGFGLYDMLGNIGEFCLDKMKEHTTDTPTAVIEPDGRPSCASGSSRTVRGGNAKNAAAYKNRAAFRQAYVGPTDRYAECGFRLWAPAIAK